MTKAHLDPERSALILVDIQNDFCHEKGAKALMGADIYKAQVAVSVIERLIEKARVHRIPIVYVYTTHSSESSSKAWLERPNSSTKLDIVAKGSWGAQFYRISPLEGDIVLEKHRYSAFIQTELEDILCRLDRTSLIITGVATNVCVESTARHAFMLDFHVTLARDGCAGYHPDLDESTFRNIRSHFGLVLDAKEILDYWEEAVVQS